METVLLDFDRVKILDPHETESVFIALQSMRNVWLQRTNWHPALEIAGPDSNLEKYIHYYTVGATLYMDCLLYTSPSPRDLAQSRMPSSA